MFFIGGAVKLYVFFIGGAVKYVIFIGGAVKYAFLIGGEVKHAFLIGGVRLKTDETRRVKMWCEHTTAPGCLVYRYAM